MVSVEIIFDGEVEPRQGLAQLAPRLLGSPPAHLATLADDGVWLGLVGSALLVDLDLWDSV